MSPAIKLLRGKTFAALAVPNYRLYFAGQAISLIGTWMQMTAQSWLVLTLTHSATGPRADRRAADAAGAAARAVRRRDRRPGRQAQADDRAAGAMGVQALILGVLTVTGTQSHSGRSAYWR